jgi:hypothetical protein
MADAMTKDADSTKRKKNQKKIDAHGKSEENALRNLPKK